MTSVLYVHRKCLFDVRSVTVDLFRFWCSAKGTLFQTSYLVGWGRCSVRISVNELGGNMYKYSLFSDIISSRTIYDSALI